MICVCAACVLRCLNDLYDRRLPRLNDGKSIEKEKGALELAGELLGIPNMDMDIGYWSLGSDYTRFVHASLLPRT